MRVVIIWNAVRTSIGRYVTQVSEERAGRSNAWTR
jgi:hypothetical protein